MNAPLTQYPLFEALRRRRSRRVGLGMTIPAGPFAYASPYQPSPLTEDEEAALAFAACGVTGYALADLAYGAQEGGAMLAGWLGRTVASADAVNTVAVVLVNDTATYLLKRPQDFSPQEFPELVRLAEAGELTELYRRSRVLLAEKRIAPSLEPGYNFPINRSALYAPGTTYLLPIIATTAITINALLELFDPRMGVFLRDERALLRPAGVARYARSRGGHLYDDPKAWRTATIQAAETSLMESCASEHGMVLQNLGLMAEALGLGGYPNFARHEFSWFQALGFRMGEMPASRYLGLPRFASWAAGLLGKDSAVPYPLGLELNGVPLLKPYCPPYYRTMTEAVHAYVETKYGPDGAYRGGAERSAWRDPASLAPHCPAPSDAAVNATADYCEYIYRRYGRFPAYTAPFRTILGFQACHLDIDFYERFYRPEALSPSIRRQATESRNQESHP